MNLTDPVAPLRSDVHTLLSQDGDNEVILLHDPLEIAIQDIAIDTDTLFIIELMDGERSVQDIHNELRTRLQTEIDMVQLIKFIKTLDDMMYLENDAYNNAMEFLESDLRPAVCAGTVYPDNHDELNTFLHNILNSTPSRTYPSNAHAALIPHIDFRVNKEIYAQVFNTIKDSEFDVVVHIGTSHYGWQDRFILTDKDFQTPLGVLQTDKQLVEDVRERLSFDLTFNDLAYQPEHSLELHHVFLQHLFPKRDFTILPILVTSFADLIQTDRSISEDEFIQEFCTVLKAVIDDSGKKPLYIVSGDLSHVGKRFGDDFSASTKLDDLKITDYEVMDALVRGKAELFYSRIAEQKDQHRICGLPPTFTMLQTLKPGKGVALDYGQWDDAPTESAVTFGSAAWFPA